MRPGDNQRHRASSLARILLATLAVLSLAGISYAYIHRWDIGYTSDTALIGLMAKSILVRGERPLFVWSVGYQGMLLEGYLTALFFKLFGTNPTVLNFAPTVYLWAALGIWTHGAAKLSGWTTALLALAFTIFSVPLFYHMNLRTLPNFP